MNLAGASAPVSFRWIMQQYCKPDFPKRMPCKLAFVGEAPSDAEMIDGTPLVGPSGRVFNGLLRTADIDRRECLVTNVFNEQAPDNDLEQWTCSHKDAVAKGWPLENDFDGRYFEPGFLRANLARLKAELVRARPTVIVPLGNAALWALTGFTGITGARGAVMAASRLVPGTKMVPTLHPAAVIHQWKYFTVVAADMVKAAAEAERGPKIIHTRREIWIEPTLADLAHFAKNHLSKSTLISLDIETTRKPSRQITTIGFAPDATRALVIPFTDWRKPSRSYWPTLEAECQAWQFVAEWCACPTPKLLQNGPYDVYWLWELMGIPVLNYVEDTRLLHHSLYAELPKDLGFMGACYANVGAWKQWRSGKAAKKDD